MDADQTAAVTEAHIRAAVQANAHHHVALLGGWTLVAAYLDTDGQYRSIGMTLEDQPQEVTTRLLNEYRELLTPAE